jgi:prepilin-type N-terminal cleavage/methylation domain-containing protein
MVVAETYLKTKLFKRRQRQWLGRDQQGMTLVEVVIALVVTGLAVGGIIGGYNFCTSAAQKAALIQAANARAMERVEEARSVKWDASSWPSVDQLVASNFPTKTVTLDMSGSGDVVTTAVLETQISRVSTNPPLKRVRVNCIWRFRSGPFITNTIETFRAPDQ